MGKKAWAEKLGEGWGGDEKVTPGPQTLVKEQACVGAVGSGSEKQGGQERLKTEGSAARGRQSCFRGAECEIDNKPW